MSRRSARQWLGIGLAFAAMIFVADQVSKLAIRELLQSDGPSLSLLANLTLVTVWNRGVSFGLLQHEAEIMPYVLSAMSVVISVALGLWLRRAQSLGMALAIGAIIGGAMGNVIDRLIFGAVFDFVSVHVGRYAWPAFNVADSAIVLGVLTLLLVTWRRPHPNPDPGSSQTSPSEHG